MLTNLESKCCHGASHVAVPSSIKQHLRIIQLIIIHFIAAGPAHLDTRTKLCKLLVHVRIVEGNQPHIHTTCYWNNDLNKFIVRVESA